MKLYTVVVHNLQMCMKEYRCCLKFRRGDKLNGRSLTGLPMFTNTDKLYSETGWTTLSSRRHNRKFQLFYNIKNGHAPNCLRELIPPIVQSTTIYPLRNGSDLIIHFCRLSITTEYFIPSTVKLWNRLD